MIKNLLLSLILICCLNASPIDVFAQKYYRGIESYVTKEGSHYIRFTKELLTGKDNEGENATNTTTYITRYGLYDDNSKLFMYIIAEHFKKKGEVYIYIVPYNGVNRDTDNIQTYGYSVNGFKDLRFVDGGIYSALGSDKSVAELSFYSASKEHVKIHQIMDKVLNNRLHYTLEK